MDVDRVGNVAGIAARHGDRDRNARTATGFQNHPVTLQQPHFCYLQASKPIILVGVSACQVNCEIGATLLDRLVQPLLQRRQVRRVTGSVLQRNVEIAALLTKGIVLRAVDGKGEDRLVTGEDGCDPIPLMHIAVDDNDAPDTSFRLHDAGGDHTVVEYAVPLAVVGEGVVGAACQACRDPIAAQCSATGGNRCADRTA